MRTYTQEERKRRLAKYYDLRWRLGFTVLGAAKKLGVRYATLRRWERVIEANNEDPKYLALTAFEEENDMESVSAYGDTEGPRLVAPNGCIVYGDIDELVELVKMLEKP